MMCAVCSTPLRDRHGIAHAGSCVLHTWLSAVLSLLARARVTCVGGGRAVGMGGEGCGVVGARVVDKVTQDRA